MADFIKSAAVTGAASCEICYPKTIYEERCRHEIMLLFTTDIRCFGEAYLLLYLENTEQYEKQSIDKFREMAKNVVRAVAYLRTSSAANVGHDKDSDKRQRAAIAAFAKANGYEVVDEYYDAAVSGADPVTDRPGFMEMMHRVATNGAKTIIVESPDRFARDLTVQLTGHDMLRDMGIELVPASAPDFFLSDTPTAVLVRQVLGAIAEFEKASTVAKLAAARKRKREATGKCEGRKGHAEVRPDVVKLVKKLGRPRGKMKPLSLRKISAELGRQGYLNEKGCPFNPKSIKVMLAA